ncbi:MULTISPECIES: lysozyme [unclassified Paraburkholderia]|uniref:lysozyme n=1 Tax=unclassified Paraburkholderia TaxID=2615204 RepID=UPI002AB0B87F|nr:MULTISPECIES: lysozyme [unclassified Paraburkholderia]
MNPGDVLAKSGVLLHPNNTPLLIVGNQNVSMLHFEAYSGQGGFSPNSTINSSSLPGSFHRRSDLIDSLAMLQEGYRATFLDAPALTPVGDRIPIFQLELSDRGKDFVRCWESVKYDSSKQNIYYYNDSNGFCIVGRGSLVNRKSCASLGFTENVSKISVEEAQSLFEKDIAKNGGYVKDAIKVPLYQHEVDALVSLAFNVGHISIVPPKLCQKINNCDYTGAPVEFLDMEIPKRRQREHDMFRNGPCDASH